ncbi:hypothetical protein WN943_012015 [Citrus x changshan-huyou]
MENGKKKIEIKKIENAKSRMVTFSNRGQRLFQKALHYTTYTNSLVARLLISLAGKTLHSRLSSLGHRHRQVLKTTVEKVVTWVQVMLEEKVMKASESVE